MSIATRQPPPYKRRGYTPPAPAPNAGPNVGNPPAAPTPTDPVTAINEAKGQPRNVYETAAVHNIDVPNAKIQQYLDGSDWEVEYYNRLLTEDDDGGALDAGAPDPMQQYTKIHHMVLKVTEPLGATTAGDTEGSAKVTAGVKPQEGDLFKATLSGGREALLHVVEVKDEFYNTNDVYSIRYRIDSFLDHNHARFDDLQSKIAREKYFDKGFIFTESDPLLLKSAYRDKKDIENYLEEIVDNWVHVAKSNTNTISIPGIHYNIVDPYVEDFMFNIVDFSQVEELTYVNRSDREHKKTLFDLLLNRNKFRSDFKTTIGAIHSSELKNDPLYKEIRYSKVDGLIAFDTPPATDRTKTFYNMIAASSLSGDVYIPPGTNNLQYPPVFLTGSEGQSTDGLHWVVGLPLQKGEVVHLTNSQSINLFNAIKAKVDAYLAGLATPAANGNPPAGNNGNGNPAPAAPVYPATEDEMAALLLELGMDQQVVDFLKGKGLFDKYAALPPETKPDKNGIKLWLRSPAVGELFAKWLEANGITLTDALKTMLANTVAAMRDKIIKILPEKTPISGTYVLSDEFYKGEFHKVSLLELMVNDYLNDNVVSHVMLLKVIDDIHNWTALQKFYYMPIVYILSLYVLRTTSSAG